MVSKIFAWVWLVVTIFGMLGILASFGEGTNTLFTLVYGFGIVYINIKYIESLK